MEENGSVLSKSDVPIRFLCLEVIGSNEIYLDLFNVFGEGKYNVKMCCIRMDRKI